jgi:hypothetical protein
MAVRFGERGARDHMSRETPRTLLELLISSEQYTWSELEDRFNRQAHRPSREAGEQITSLTWRQLQRIAAGEVARPRPATARVLEQMFGRPIAELIAPPPGQSAGREVLPHESWEDDMRRRVLLSSAGGAVAGGALAALDPVRRQLDATLGGRITDHDVTEWERAANEYSHLTGRLPTEQILPGLLIDLEDVRRHLAASPDALRPGLLRVCAFLGGLAAISLVCSGYWGDAGRYWRLAQRSARLSGDQGVYCLIGGRRAVFSSYTPGCPPEITLEIADDTIQRGDGRPLSGIASAHAARAQILAAQGDRSGARAALNDLETVFNGLDDKIRANSVAEWGWSESRLRHVQSFVNSHSGNVREAASAQDAALALYTRPESLGAAQVRLHQAMSMILSGDPSQGVRHAAGVLSLLEPSFRRGFVRTSALQTLRALPERAAKTAEVRQVHELLSESDTT